MKEELKSHIKKLQRRATLSLVAIILTIISISFGILLLYVQPFAAISFCGIAIGCIVYLILSNRNAKKPSFIRVYPKQLDLTENEESFVFSEYSSFFCYRSPIYFAASKNNDFVILQFKPVILPKTCYGVFIPIHIFFVSRIQQYLLFCQPKKHF